MATDQPTSDESSGKGLPPGTAFGGWTVLGPVRKSTRRNRGVDFLCRCRCGRESWIKKYDLRKGLTAECHSCASTRYVCSPGLKFGAWVTLGERKVSDSGGPTVFWLCRCAGSVCGGSTHWVRRCSLTSGRSTGCPRCAGPKKSAKQRVSNGYVEGRQRISGERWSSMRYNAARRGHEMAISKEEAEAIFTGKCALTGWPICLEWPIEAGRVKRSRRAATASLDRIDNSKGYILGNVQWVHKDVNRMKNVHGMGYFLRLCRAVTEHSGSGP